MDMGFIHMMQADNPAAWLGPWRKDRTPNNWQPHWGGAMTEEYVSLRASEADAARLVQSGDGAVVRGTDGAMRCDSTYCFT